MLGIVDEYVAYCFDESVGYMGTYIEGEIDGVKAGKNEAITRGKKENVLRKYLGMPQKFRDPTPTRPFRPSE